MPGTVRTDTSHELRFGEVKEYATQPGSDGVGYEPNHGPGVLEHHPKFFSCEKHP